MLITITKQIEVSESQVKAVFAKLQRSSVTGIVLKSELKAGIIQQLNECGDNPEKMITLEQYCSNNGVDYNTIDFMISPRVSALTAEKSAE